MKVRSYSSRLKMHLFTFGMYQLVLGFGIYTVVCLPAAVYGLTCSCGNIQEGQDVECQCDTYNGIQWFKGDTEITTCGGRTCIPPPPVEYTFSYTGSSTYKITISTFSLTNCKGYSAKDLTTLEIVIFPYCPGLTCTCGNIQEGQDAECQCDTENYIEWFKGDNTITRCVRETCMPTPPAGYTMAYTGSTYKITISTFSFTNCKGYTAKDLTTMEIAIFPYCPGLTCTCGNIQDGQDVECQCDTGNPIQWFKGDLLTSCNGATCRPSPPTGYKFSHNGSTYKITISTFSVSDCKGYSAKDVDTLDIVNFPYCPELTMTKPTSGGTINIEENTPDEFICKMVSGYSAGTVEWYVDSGTPNNVADDVKITLDISNSSAINNQEYTTTSTLTLSPSRSYTGYRVYCKATNKPKQTPLVSQRKPRLNILYYAGGPTITEGSSYKVIETRSGQLSCVVTGGNPSPTVTWNCNSGTQSSTSTGDSKTRTVTWTADRDNSNTCTCTSSQTGLQTRSIATQITVLYPPSAPTFKISGQTITGDIKLIVNSSRQIQCVSTGSPNPTIVWEKLAGSSATSSGRNLSFTSVSKTTDHGTYTCRASNVMDPTDLPTQPETRTSARDIVVLYPPSMLNFYYGTLTGPLISSKTIDVVKGATFSIGCKSMDGEPESTIRWNGQPANGPILTVQQISESVTGKTCSATNQMLASGTSTTQHGSISDNFSFNVLIPPTITICEFYNSKTNSVLTNESTLMILEGESFTLTCSAAGKPAPNPSWSGPLSTVSSWSLPVNDVSRQRKGIYTFSATSVIEPSFQPSRTISANETIQIEILYPPVVEQMADISGVKGSELTVDCSVTKGFPTETTTQWKRDIDSKTWDNKPLYIQSIKKSDAGRYTCVASNTMRPSGDTQSYPGRDEKHFILTVLYEASVTSFYVDGFKDDTEVTVDEGNPVMFKCSADSYPTANITLTKNIVLLQSESSNILYYFISKASCLDTSSYSCGARNVLNLETPMENVKLFVNCLPRSADAVNPNRTSERNETFTFTFNAIAYPVPDFKWKKSVNNEWKPIPNDGNVHITSSGLQSNLTIYRMRQSDFGQYLIVITNDVGEFDQLYQLEPYDVPDVPTEFRHVETMATQSALQLEWKTGSDGGLPQIFYIKYKTSSRHTWSYVGVSDAGEPIMRYQLTGLKSDTTYQLIIYSSNRYGNSSDSDIVTAKTKGEEETANVGALVGGAVGGVFGIAIFIVLVIVVLWRYRFHTGNKNCDTELKDRNQHETNKPSEDVSYYNIGRSADLQMETERTDNKEATDSKDGSALEYEALNNQNRDVTTYSTLQPVRNNSTNVDTSDENKTYENLKLRVI